MSGEGVAERIAARIRREGSISFADFQAMALYEEPGGFFARGAGAGRAGRDFVTSPEVGSLFGRLVARHLDGVWGRLGRPDPFVVVDAGAGRGRLAADVLRAEPSCAPALRYLLVERSGPLRAEQREHLDLEPADEALGPFTRGVDPDDPAEVVPGSGPIVSALADLPAITVVGVIVANELLDNLPVHVVERTPSGWAEVRVVLDDEGRLAEEPVRAPPELAAEADHVVLGTDVPTGARVPVPVAARDWIERAALLVARGEALVIDYAEETGALVERGQAAWLRTYAAHGRGTTPFDAPGSQDITCDLPLGYVRSIASRAHFEVIEETTQAQWLQALGIGDLVAEGERTWRARAHIGDLVALEGRSRAVEAAALTDPTGLGAHRVIVLRRARP